MRVTVSNGDYHNYGKDAVGFFASQTIDRTTGVKSAVTRFQGQNGNSSGLTVIGVRTLINGEIIYVGESDNRAANVSATYLNDSFEYVFGTGTFRSRRR